MFSFQLEFGIDIQALKAALNAPGKLEPMSRMFPTVEDHARDMHTTYTDPENREALKRILNKLGGDASTVDDDLHEYEKTLNHFRSEHEIAESVRSLLAAALGAKSKERTMPLDEFTAGLRAYWKEKQDDAVGQAIYNILCEAVIVMIGEDNEELVGQLFDEVIDAEK